MYLYRRQKDKIEVYRLSAKYEQIRDYKEKVLDKYTDEELFYTYKANCITPGMSLKLKRVTLPMSALNFDNVLLGGNTGATFEPEETTSMNKSKREIILRNFLISDPYVLNSPIKIIKDYEETIYALFAEPIKNKERGLVVCENIMILPTKLYYLTELEIGNFKEVEDKNIAEQLELFDLEKDGEVNLKEIKRAYNYNLIDINLNGPLDKIKTSEKILEKIK